MGFLILCSSGNLGLFINLRDFSLNCFMFYGTYLLNKYKLLAIS